MSDYNHHPSDPWDQDSYQTGSTQPPKNRGGFIAVLLTVVILLAGISTAMGVMNVKLFQQLQEQEGDQSQVSFDATASSAPTTQNSPDASEVTVPQGEDIRVELNAPPATVPNIPQEGGLSFQEIYEKNIPSVVSVLCQLSSGSSSGTGVVLSENGYIVTNCHVVEGARSITLRFTDGRELAAQVVGADAVSDLAVLYVQSDDLTPAEFGDSAQLRVGDTVAAIGDPLGVEFRGTMTDGIVSAINRDVTTQGRTMTLIQTNAALNSGNSGGPLINCHGQVIGINTLKISAFVDDAGVEGLGFAIPSTTVKEVVEQLITQGYVSGRPSLGITGDTVTRTEQQFYRLPAGVLITEVEDGSSADNAGIAPGDILLAFGSTRIESAEDLTAALYGCSAGDEVQLTLYRYRTGKQYTVTVILGEKNG